LGVFVPCPRFSCQNSDFSAATVNIVEYFGGKRYTYMCRISIVVLEERSVCAMPDFETRVQLAIPSPTKLFTPAVTAILILMVAGWAVISYAPDFTLNWLALSSQGLLRGRIWQLVTYSFVNGCSGNLIFNGLMVLFIGSAIEREWRTRSFVALWLVVSVSCGAIWFLVNLIGGWNYIGLGTGACGYGIIGTFGLLFRRKRFFALFWSVEAQHIAWMLIGIGLVLGIARPISWIWVAGALVAYVYVKLRWAMQSSSTYNRPAAVQGRRGGFVDVD
jgi:membrane associated rhomboid family serine protease